MAGINSENKTTIAFKNLLGKSNTDTSKSLGNEAEGIFFNIGSSNVWLSTIDPTPNNAVSSGIAVYVEANLVEDLTSNNHAYFAEWPATPPVGTDPTTGLAYAYGSGLLSGISSGDRVRNSIPPSYGYLYEAKPYIGAALVPPDDSRNWIFQYNSGVLWQESSAYSDPTKIRIYMYSGNTLSGTSFGSMGMTGATGPAGPIGATGSQGTPGETLSILGIYPDYSGLTQAVGTSYSITPPGDFDSYILQSGDVLVYNPSSPISNSEGWVDMGSISGPQGLPGTSGTSGISGTSGTSGESGTSGTSGESGTSGTSGESGTSGTSGQDGNAGSSGTSGTSGTSGSSGTSGAKGDPGETLGIQGIYADYAGLTQAAGTSYSIPTPGNLDSYILQSGDVWVYNPSSPASNTDGWVDMGSISGPQGLPGTPGAPGTSGTSGSSGTSGAKGDPGDTLSIQGIYDNYSGLTQAVGTSYTIPTPTNLSSYILQSGDVWVYNPSSPISNLEGWVDMGSISGPQGLSGAPGTSGTSGESGSSGTSGTSGISGSSGTSGAKGDPGETLGIQGIYVDYAGLTQAAGTSYSIPTPGNLDSYILQSGDVWVYNPSSPASNSEGWVDMGSISGPQGLPGANGTSGTSGTSGESGSSGTSGESGSSGTSGESGSSGTSGESGSSGTSGESGSSGTSGESGSSGTSGTSGSSGLSGDRYRTLTNDTLGIPSLPNSKNFYVDADLAYTQNQVVIISYDTVNYMYGTVSGYNVNTGSMSVDISAVYGSTSGVTPWTINLFGAAGGDGTSGTSGIGIPAGGTAGWILAKASNSNYDVEWVENVGVGSSSLTVEDYLTGATYGNINNIVFRGNTVVIPGSLTATGATVTEDEPATPGSVMIWIPAPNYVGYFSPTLGTGNVSRYVMQPTVSTYSSVSNPGKYQIGDWNVAANFYSGTTRSIKTTSTSLAAFSAAAFSCYTNATTMLFELFDGSNTLLRTLTITLNAVGTQTSSPSGISITISSFSADNDRYKAVVSGAIATTLFPNGGRFFWRITHNNGYGPGSSNDGPVVSGVYKYKSDSVFYDIDIADNSISSASISSAPTFDEKTPVLRYYSGVAYYNINTTFGMTVSGINLLNDLTIPTTKQIDIVATNMAVGDTHDGYADGTKTAISAFGITGWTFSWSVSGLTYSRTANANLAARYFPDYVGTAGNQLSSSNSSITARIYDYGVAATSASAGKKMLFDTYSPGSVYYNNNPLDSETGRLSTTGVMSNGSSAFSSSAVLASDELQYIFGRIIYPQHNFVQYYPSANFLASVDYSALSGSSKTFNTYTKDGLDTGSGTTAANSLNGYRWHVTPYSKDSGATTNMSNGIFTFDSNFTEAVLSYNGALSAAGTGDLEILIGIDSSGSNATPDKFIYVSGNPVTWGARYAPATYNLDQSPKKIQWTLGTLGVSVRKIWLFVGYKNSATGKNLWMTNIAFS